MRLSLPPISSSLSGVAGTMPVRCFEVLEGGDRSNGPIYREGTVGIRSLPASHRMEGGP
jgi:hypothetical protein